MPDNCLEKAKKKKIAVVLVVPLTYRKRAISLDALVYIMLHFSAFKYLCITVYCW